MLSHEGTFIIYVRDWKHISNCSVGGFHPTTLTSFEMAATVAAGAQPWLEVGVSGATETIPNPGYQD